MDKNTLQQALAYIGVEFGKLGTILDKKNPQIEEINTLLRFIAEKKDPEPIEFPEMPVTDLSETNALLKQLVEKEKEEVIITLKVI